jgi:hypothetical protein
MAGSPARELAPGAPRDLGSRARRSVRIAAALRQPARAARIALVLWIAWAVVVWNVVFDHVIVASGRAYIHAAAVAAQRGGPFARMDDWMRPAVTRGLWIASLAALAILLIGLVGIRAAARTR